MSKLCSRIPNTVSGVLILVALFASTISIFLLNTSTDDRLHEEYLLVYYSNSVNDSTYNSTSTTNIDIPETNYSINSYWHHNDHIQLYNDIISRDIQSYDSYSFNELQKMYELFGCPKQKQMNCANGISSKCKIHDFWLCDLPKLTNGGANCNLNDLSPIIINSYKKKQIPKIYHLVLQIKPDAGRDMQWFGYMYYLGLKSYDKYADADAIILHYIIMEKEKLFPNNTFTFSYYENDYFQDSLKFITHYCEWDYIHRIFGNKYGNQKDIQSSGNILRIFTTTMFGGIYYDLDVFMFNASDSHFEELLYNNPSHTMIPQEYEPQPETKNGVTNWLCSCVTIAMKWSIFNIEWIYQLQNEQHQIGWVPAWARIAVQLPKHMSDKLFIGNDKGKYIRELDASSFFDAQYYEEKPWHLDGVDNGELWCKNGISSYGWHYCNNARGRNVREFWEMGEHNITLAKELRNVPFSRILRHLMDDVPMCTEQ